MLANRNLSVALHRQLVQMRMLAVPSWHHVQLVYGYALRGGVAQKCVIYTQSRITKILLKVYVSRGICAQARRQHHE